MHTCRIGQAQGARVWCRKMSLFAEGLRGSRVRLISYGEWDSFVLSLCFTAHGVVRHSQHPSSRTYRPPRLCSFASVSNIVPSLTNGDTDPFARFMRSHEKGGSLMSNFHVDLLPV